MPRFPGLLLATMILSAIPASAQEAITKAPTADEAKKERDPAGWEPLFNGKDLDGWKVTNFGGEGKVSVEGKGVVVIREGVDLSGLTTTRMDLPTTNYEVRFEAQRAAGNDFFVGFTFPVGKESCSLILGGWGGGVCGLSSLDHMDASENSTTWYDNFTVGKWYKVRVRVTDDLIQAWVDDKEMISVERELYHVGVRFEMEACKPMGFATYQTVSHIRKAKIRSLKDDDATDESKDAAPDDPADDSNSTRK